MTLELKILVWTAVLAFIEVIVAAVAAQTQIRLPELAGNRDSLPPLTGWAGRAQRAYRNTYESLPLFIVLVLAAHLAGRTNGTVLLGCQLFFWGRVAHWLIYLAGIPWVRTLAWLVAVIGLIAILS
ncbi:MAG: MAPEG family protein, partial [Alphaproteobacteria bacterium]|nr:MAPEG family protein [Alphaproteobacteria bacterium]